MGGVEKITGFVFLATGVALHFATWPWIMAFGVVLGGTVLLILPGKVMLSILVLLSGAWVWSFFSKGSVSCLVCFAATIAITGVLALRHRLLGEWNELLGEPLPFLAKRKLYRMCGLFFPLVLFPLWGLGAYRITLGCLAVAIFLAEILRKRSPVFDRGFSRFFAGVSKKKEAERVSGTAWYLWGATIASFFPGLAGPAALVMMTLGDAWAVMAGMRWGRYHILGKKTALGTFACFAAAFFAGFAFANLNSHAPVPVVLYIAGASVSAVSELITPGNWDNLTVAPATALTIWAAGLLL